MRTERRRGSGSSTERAGERVVEAHRFYVVLGAVPRPAAARQRGPRARARCRGRSARRAAPRRFPPTAFNSRCERLRLVLVEHVRHLRASSTKRARVSALRVGLHRGGRRRVVRRTPPRPGRARRAPSGMSSTGSQRRSASAGSSEASEHVDRQRAMRLEVEVDVVWRNPSSSRYARTASAGYPVSRSDDTVAPSSASRPSSVVPDDEAAVDHLRRLVPSPRCNAACSGSFGRWSEPRITCVIPSPCRR